MLDERKATILRAVVTEYIETAQPVGSGHVARSARGRTSRRPPCATTWPRSRPRATSPSPTPAPAGCPPRRATGSSSTSSVARAASAPPRPSRCGPSSPTPTASSSRCCTTPAASCRASPATPRWWWGRPTRSPPCGRCSWCRSRPRVVLAVLVLSNGAIEKHTLDLDHDTEELVVNAAGARLANELVGHPLSAGRVGPVDEPARSAPEGDAVTAVLRATVGRAPGRAPPRRPGVHRWHLRHGRRLRRGRHRQRDPAHPRAAARRREPPRGRARPRPVGRHRHRDRQPGARRLLPRRRPLRRRRRDGRHHRRARARPACTTTRPCPPSPWWPTASAVG